MGINILCDTETDFSIAVGYLECTDDPFKVGIAIKAIEKALTRIIREQPIADPFFHLRKHGIITTVKTSLTRVIESLSKVIR